LVLQDNRVELRRERERERVCVFVRVRVRVRAYVCVCGERWVVGYIRLVNEKRKITCKM
jgi:hypothetical protein